MRKYSGVDQVPRKGPPLIAIPTTAGTGSEVTNVAILSDKVAQLKKGIVSDYLLPDVALISPQMTLTCPRSVTAASGVDALVHAIESYLSLNASPITDALAIGAIRLIANALPKAYANPTNLQARDDMATASCASGAQCPQLPWPLPGSRPREPQSCAGLPGSPLRHTVASSPPRPGRRRQRHLIPLY